MEARRAIDVELVEAGERLREKREAAGVGVTLMAHLLNCTTKTIENYERGRTNGGGAVEFAYDNIDLLMASRLGRRDLSCDVHYGLQDPLPFGPAELPVVVSLRDRVVNNLMELEPVALYAKTG